MHFMYTCIGLRNTHPTNDNQPGATTRRSEGRKTWLRRLSLVSNPVRTLYLDLSNVNLPRNKLPESLPETQLTKFTNILRYPSHKCSRIVVASIRISCSSTVHVKTESMAIAMHPTRDAKQLGDLESAIRGSTSRRMMTAHLEECVCRVCALFICELNTKKISLFLAKFYIRLGQGMTIFLHFSFGRHISVSVGPDLHTRAPFNAV